MNVGGQGEQANAARVSEDNQAFLLTLNDALRPLSDAAAIQQTASRLLGEHLGVERVAYAEIAPDGETAAIVQDWHRSPLPSLVGRYRLEDFGISIAPLFRTDQDVIVEDAADDPRLTPPERAHWEQSGVRATIGHPLTKAGQVVAYFTVHQERPRRWTDREIALLSEVAERIRAAVERERAEKALRASEEKYRTLFNSIDEGFCVIELLYDGAGVAVDYRFQEVNAVFERQTGLVNPIGKRGSVVAPGTERHWLDRYDRVVQTGDPVRFEDDNQSTGRWYTTYASRIGGTDSRLVCTVFDDITERKRREANLALLAEITGELVGMDNITEAMHQLGETIGHHFGVKHCMFSEVVDFETAVTSDGWNAEDAPSLKGTYWMRDFLTDEQTAASNAGKLSIVADTQTDVRVNAKTYGALGIHSFIIVPLVRGGQWRFLLSIIDNKPRVWRDDEIELMRELTTRLWTRLERSRAEASLHESEARQAFLLTFSDAIRSLKHPLEIQQVASRLLGEYLNTTRAYYFLTEPVDGGNWIHHIETDYLRDPGMHSHAGRHFVSNFGLGLFEGAERGKVVAVEDVTQVSLLTPSEIQNYLAVDVRAFINVPLIKDGKFVAGIGAHDSSPRFWKPVEIALIQEVAERIWSAVERARAEEALRESEAKLAIELADTQLLHRISGILIEEENVSHLYEQILDAARSIMGSEMASIQRFIPERNELLLLASQNFAPESAVFWERVKTDGNSSHSLAIEIEKQIIVPDVECWDFVAGTKDLDHYRLSGIRAMQSTRLISRTGRLVGMISTHWRDVHAPSERELRVFDVLARQAADFIERRTAQQALRESEAQLRTLSDAVPQIIWTNSTNGTANFFNRRWYEYSGLSFEQSVGLGWQAIVHPDDAPASTHRWNRGLAASATFDTEYRLRRADGAYRWFIGRNVPLTDNRGQVVGWFGTATDIDDLKQAEAARRTIEERFRLLVEGARDYAMFLLDSEGQITFWSAGAERVFGWSESEVLGRTMEFLFTPEDRAMGRPAQEIATAEQKEHALDRRWHLRKDGSRFWADGILMRLNDERGSLRGFAKVARDATDQKRAEDTITEANETLEQRVAERTEQLLEMSQLRQELLRKLIGIQEEERAHISRDLHDDTGQILTALLLGLENLKSVPALAADAEVQQRLQFLQSLTGEVTQKAYRLSFTLRPTDLDDIGLMGALTNYTEQWSQWSGIPVEVDSIGWEQGGRLPPEIETTVYRVAQEALTNVLRHALPKASATEPKPSASRVSIVVQRRRVGVNESGTAEEEVLTIIEDDGPGFAVEAALSLPPGKRRLGLFGMQERARLAGGTLLIESESGLGTTVYLRLPLPAS